MIKSRMSSARQAVQRADNFTGFGNRPDFTPSHQHVLPSGMTLSTWGNRKKPVSGISYMSTHSIRPMVSHKCVSVLMKLALRATLRQSGVFTIEDCAPLWEAVYTVVVRS